MSGTYNCPRHNKTVETGQPCKQCVSEIKSLLKKKNYTQQERLETFDRWASKGMRVVTVDFNDIHELIDLLVGREVWLHELARPQDIREEILFDYKRSFRDVLDDLGTNYPDLEVITQDIEPEDKDKWN